MIIENKNSAVNVKYRQALTVDQPLPVFAGALHIIIPQS